MHERRAHPRVNVSLRGRILLDRAASLRCEIVDRSEGGCRVKVHSARNLPSRILIDLPSLGSVLRGEIAWRGQDQIGVRILTEWALPAE